MKIGPRLVQSYLNNKRCLLFVLIHGVYSIKSAISP